MLRLQSDILGREAKKVEKHWSRAYPDMLHCGMAVVRSESHW